MDGGDGVLAVDFGSSTTVAVLRAANGRCRPLLFDGSPLLPSAVFAPARGDLVAGRDAALLARDDPARFEPAPKRRVDDGAVLLGDREVAVTDLVAAVLRRVADEARRVAGVLPPAVLTHPVAWGPVRRDVLTAAAARAGLTVTALVAEPTAAARYFTTVLGSRLGTGRSLAVFDFGGGTVDIAVVRRSAAVLEVTATGGLDDLGGIDLDAAVVGRAGEVLRATDPVAWRRLDRPATRADRRQRELFWQDARLAREMLSRSAAATLHVPGTPAAAHLTRAEFEVLAAPLLGRAVTEAARTIARAGLTPPQLAGVFLVGGASRTPLVAHLLHRALGIAPTVLEQPETAVAEGAAHPQHPADADPAPAFGSVPDLDGAPAPDVDAGPDLPRSASPAAASPAVPPPGRRRAAVLVAGTAAIAAAAVTLAVLHPWQASSGQHTAGGTPTASASARCPTIKEATEALTRSGDVASGYAPALADDPKCWQNYAFVVYALQNGGHTSQGGKAILKRTGSRWDLVRTSEDLCQPEGPHADQRPSWADDLPDDVLRLAGCRLTDYVS